MGDEHNSSFMHTILGRGGRFYCNNLRAKGRMIGIPGKYLAIGADGTLSNDTWRYMRHVDRCYRIRTVAVPDEETEVRRKKRERSQHADFQDGRFENFRSSAPYYRIRARSPFSGAISAAFPGYGFRPPGPGSAVLRG